jgi:ABC-2 type transport system ATP-binding protein
MENFMNTASPTRYALRMRHISVKRESFQLEVADLALRSGEIACVVGANGSGKTSLLLTALGLLPHEGLCRVDGMYYDGTQPLIKACLGFIPDDPDLLFSELTAYEQWSVTASVLASMRGMDKTACISRADMFASRLSFDPPARPTREYSHGMRRKTQIVNALLGVPSVLIVDELRNGLDPIAITQAEQLIKEESARGAAILAATHDLWWAERFADYIYVMDHGHIIATGTVKQLREPGEKSLEEAFCRIIGAEV